ncbi:hypothetical protein LSH36_85g03027, partial [Paralvinella palmiformis]
VRFEEIFAEPEGVQSADCIWRSSYRCFNGTLGCCYRFLTLLCSLPTAFCWACQYACIACCHVWCITPWLTYLQMYLQPSAVACSLMINAYCVPVCEAFALCFSKITVKNIS